MTDRPLLFVCGIRRSGCSAVMQMLAAAGMPVRGQGPAHESVLAQPPRMWRSIATLRGNAVKLLDPHVAAPPPVNARPDWPGREDVPPPFPWLSIWVERHPEQVARSRLKLLQATAGTPKPSTRSLRVWRRDVVDEAARARAAIAWRAPCLAIRFEDLLCMPWTTASAIAAFLAPRFGALDPGVMADAIRRRHPDCLPGLDLALERSRPGGRVLFPEEDGEGEGTEADGTERGEAA